MADDNENKEEQQSTASMFELDLEKGPELEAEAAETEVKEPEQEAEPEVKAEEPADNSRDELEQLRLRNDELAQAVEAMSKKPVESPKDPFEEMPDAALDPAGHKRWMKERFQERDQKDAERDQRDAQEKQAQKLRELEQEFDAKFPDLATPERKILVQQATTEEIMKTGATPEARSNFVFNNREKFMEKVADNTKEKLKALGVNTDPEPPNRTAGVGGGSQGGAKPKVKSDPEVVSLQSAVKKEQAESGFF